MSADNESRRTPSAAVNSAEPTDVGRPTWTAAELDAAMAKVPAYEREIFMLHRLDGLSYLEIAERYGISVGRVERALIKALRRLRHAIERQTAMIAIAIATARLRCRAVHRRRRC